MSKATEGISLINRLSSGDLKKAAPKVIEATKNEVSSACEEILSVGARIRPLMVGEHRIGWVRGVHLMERMMLERWCGGLEYIESVLLLATSFTRQELDKFSGREIYRLGKLVKDMTEYDLSLIPYMTAFTTTRTSEALWHGKGHTLTGFENKIIHMPDEAKIKIMAPSRHAELWGTLCTYREQSKARLDGMMNATMIVRPWVGNKIDSFVAELRTSMKNMAADAIGPWETVVSTVVTDLNDGWGHPDDSRSGLLREMHGMISNDKHEQVMDAFARQQVMAAEAEAKRIDKLHKKHGGSGVMQKEGIVVFTPKQVRDREKALKRGVPIRDTEYTPTPGQRIEKYK